MKDSSMVNYCTHWQDFEWFCIQFYQIRWKITFILKKIHVIHQFIVIKSIILEILARGFLIELP